MQREVGAHCAAELEIHQHPMSAEGKLRLAGCWQHQVPWVPVGPVHEAACCGPRELRILGVKRGQGDFFLTAVPVLWPVAGSAELVMVSGSTQ